jgi:hypothetical protein
MPKTTRHKPSQCPYCGHLIDASTSAEDASPGPGDVTVCLNCREIVVFADDMSLRLPTEQELIEVAGNDKVLAVLLALADIPLKGAE